MAEFKIIRIQVARDSAADWTTNNPTLHSGEFGYEEDTGKLKIGDGSTAWTSLGYLDSGIGGGGYTQEEIQDIVNALIIDGTGITKTYNDASNTLTIALTGESYTTAEQTKLSNIEDNAEVNKTVTEIISDIDTELGTTEWKSKLTQEEVQDYMATALTGGSQTNISVTYNDANNVFDFFVSAGGGGGNLTQEEVEDIVDGLIVNGTGISKVYDDVTGVLTIGLSGEVFTTSEKNKLLTVESGAAPDQTAAEVPIADTGNYYFSTNVEDALQEVFSEKSGKAENNTYTANNIFNSTVSIGSQGFYQGTNEGVSGRRWFFQKDQSTDKFLFGYQDSAATTYAGAYTTLYTFDDSGTPVAATDLVTKDYADSTYGPGSGDVTKVGTPADNQIGVWTGDGTIEGDSNLTFNGTTLDITGNITISGTVDGRDLAADGAITDLAIVSDVTGVTGADAVTNLMTLTQSEYDAIGSPDASTLYWITDAADYSTPTSSTATAIDMGYWGGNYVSMASANAATTYTTTNPQLGGWAKVRINAASQPSVTGATLITGSTFATSTDMYMYVTYNGSVTEYWFEAI